MAPTKITPSLMRTLDWTARIGAVTAEVVAEREGCSLPSARAQLAFATRAGMLSRSAPLQGAPALYTLTRPGLRPCGLRGIEPARVRASNAAHVLACAAVAARLERLYPGHRVMGEPELRLLERERRRTLAAARMGLGAGGTPAMHRADLVLWPATEADRGIVAVEVELTVKAPRRLVEICRAWARCREVAGVVYLAAPEVEAPLARALAAARAEGRITVVPLAALPSAALQGEGSTTQAPLEGTIPAGAYAAGQGKFDSTNGGQYVELFCEPRRSGGPPDA